MTREIGTFDISSGPEVCDLLGPKHPIVNANLEHTLKEENKLEEFDLVNHSLRNLQVIRID
jgi:adenylyl- and sulfurtransferase ThiI